MPKNYIIILKIIQAFLPTFPLIKNILLKNMSLPSQTAKHKQYTKSGEHPAKQNYCILNFDLRRTCKPGSVI